MKRLIGAVAVSSVMVATGVAAPIINVATRPVAQKPGTQCFEIDKVRIKGVTQFSSAAIRKMLAPVAANCVGQVHVDALLAAINKTYIDAGYLTSRAFVPQQDLVTRILVLEVVEGTIEDFAYAEINEGTPRKGNRSIVDQAFGKVQGKILHRDMLLEGLGNINRVQSSNATVELLPGEAQGSSIVLVRNQVQDEFRLSTTYDGQYVNDVWSSSLNITAEHDNIFDVNDTWSLTYSGGKNSNGLTLSGTVPIEEWLVAPSISYSESASLLTPTSELYTLSGTSSISGTRQIYRDGNANADLSLALTRYVNERYINGAELTPQKHTYARAGISYTERGEGEAWTVGLGLTRGIPGLGGTEQSSGDDVPIVAFTKLDASAQYSRNFSDYGTLSALLTAQYSNDVLYSVHHGSVGSKGTVRGFGSLDLEGERSLVLRNQFDFNAPFQNVFDQTDGDKKYPIQRLVEGVSPYAFIDLGYVANIANDTQNALSGAGLGLKYSEQGYGFDAFVAVPTFATSTISKPDFHAGISITSRLF